jgi:hypothetical protein
VAVVPLESPSIHALPGVDAVVHSDAAGDKVVEVAADQTSTEVVARTRREASRSLLLHTPVVVRPWEEGICSRRSQEADQSSGGRRTHTDRHLGEEAVARVNPTVEVPWEMEETSSQLKDLQTASYLSVSKGLSFSSTNFD